MRTQHGDLLDQPILHLTPTDPVSARTLTAGTLVTGMTGGGKSSGPWATLLRGFCRVGMGGVLTTSKPTDLEDIQRICSETGRLGSLIVWDGANGGFNFLDWILAQGRDGVGNAIEFLMRVVEMKRGASPTPGNTGDQFWIDVVHQLLRAAIPVLHAATGTVRIEEILKFIRGAPESVEQMRDPQWQHGSFFYRTFAAAADRLDNASGRTCIAYWADDYCRLDPRTRGNVVLSLTTTLDALNTGWLRHAFCERTSIVPELCFHGAIIVLNMPVLSHHESGLLAQQIFVYAFQRAVLMRNALAPPHRERPVFLMIDEFPLFCNSEYTGFLGTCRSSRCCTVLLAQSLPSIFARMPGPNAHDRAQALVANCATKIWAANNCTVTNTWAADTIGKAVRRRASYNESEGSSSNHSMNLGEGTNWGTNRSFSNSYSANSRGGLLNGSSSSGNSDGGNDSWGRNRGTGSNYGTSSGWSEHLEYIVEPSEFSRMLRSGGPANGNRVSCIWYEASRTFSSGGNCLLAEFVQ